MGSVISANIINWGFSAQDVLKNSFVMFNSDAWFIMVGLALGVVPLLIYLMRVAVLGESAENESQLIEEE